MTKNWTKKRLRKFLQHEQNRRASAKAEPTASASAEQDIPAPAEAAAKPARVIQRPFARTAIIAPLFLRATTRVTRARLREQTLAVALIVPHDSWVDPAARAFAGAYGSHWVTIGLADKSTRERQELEKSIPRDLAAGKPVLVVGSSRGMLPQSIVRAADVEIVIQAPDAVALARSVRLFTGTRPEPLDDSAIDACNFDVVLSAFRKNSSAAEIVARLSIPERADAAASQRRLPALETAYEYGAAREWALELVRDIEDWKAGSLSWASLSRACIMYSEPGCGKSTFARILANELNAPLLAFSIADLFADSPGYLDSVIKAWRAQMEKATSLALTSPSGFSVCLIDEVDALPSREQMSAHAAAWWKSILAEVFLSIDKIFAGTGADGAGANIVLIAATNYLSGVDPALLRPGRFERAIEIKRPLHAGIMNVLRYHLDGALSECNLDETGHLLAGSTPAEIMMAVRSAKRIARQAKRDLVEQDLLDAVVPADETLSPAALERVSLHEAAHAVASIAVPFGEIQRAVIGTAGDSAGRTFIKHEEDDLLTKDIVERRSVVALAGRAAEMLMLGDAALGSGGSEDSDLASVTRSVALLHVSTGSAETLSYLASEKEALSLLRIDIQLRARVEDHIRTLHERAMCIVRANRKAIVAVAAELRSRRHLSGARIREIVADAQQSADIEDNNEES